MSVKQKLVALFCIAVTGYALVFIASFFGTRRTEAALALKATAQNAFVEVLQARRQEKNFILRREAQYTTRTLKHADQVGKLIATISAADPAMADQCAKALKQLQEYVAQFNTLARTETTVGLSEKDGVRWEFIQAGRDVEKEFKAIKDPAMTILLLQMRRQEKNYIIRGKEVYLERYRGHLAGIRKALAESPDPARQADATRVLGVYDKAFARYVDLQGKLALINTDLVQNACKLEPLIIALRDHYDGEHDCIQS